MPELAEILEEVQDEVNRPDRSVWGQLENGLKDEVYGYLTPLQLRLARELLSSIRQVAEKFGLKRVIAEIDEDETGIEEDLADELADKLIVLELKGQSYVIERIKELAARFED